MDLDYAKKQYRTVGLMTFCVAIALLVMRIVSYYVQVAFIKADISGPWIDLLNDAIFSVPVQLGILLLFPFLLYKLRLKKTFRGVAEFSGYRKCNVWICLLSVLIGFFIIGVTYGFSIFWQLILILFGYKPSGGSDLPQTFNFGYFILTVLLTAILPAVCEEFTNRGGLLTTFRGSFSENKTIVLIALAFGLFHQNITQFFYTMMLGGFLAFLVLETKSVIPAIIVHFMNNFMSIYLENASTYHWAIGGGFNDFMNSATFGQLMAMFSICLIAVFAFSFLLMRISKKKCQSDYYAEQNALIAECGFKPSLRDNIFFIGAIVVATVATILTYVFGL